MQWYHGHRCPHRAPRTILPGTCHPLECSKQRSHITVVSGSCNPRVGLIDLDTSDHICLESSGLSFVPVSNNITSLAFILHSRGPNLPHSLTQKIEEVFWALIFRSSRDCRKLFAMSTEGQVITCKGTLLVDSLCLFDRRYGSLIGLCLSLSLIEILECSCYRLGSQEASCGWGCASSASASWWSAYQDHSYCALPYRRVYSRWPCPCTQPSSV